MVLPLRRLRQIAKLLPRIYSGHHYQPAGKGVILLTVYLNYLQHICADISQGSVRRCFYSQRFSTLPKRLPKLTTEVDLLSFLQSALKIPEGPCHRWLNNYLDNKGSCSKDGVFLVLYGTFLDDSLLADCDLVLMLEKVKALQQRYPSLRVMGFHCDSSICLDTLQSHLIKTAIKEYITFPVLLVDKNFPQVAGGSCYIIFKDFRSPVVYYERDVDLGTVDKAIMELNVRHNGGPRSLFLESTWVKQIEVTKEPYVSSPLRNSLLYFPGCISVDESGDRLFLSDINHHRIIIFDGNGVILDCIGSSPGFEDGEFESAKLARPASSLYHAAEDCLYFVDSENHAIRKADMETRLITTIYPTSSNNKRGTTLWGWIMDKLWMQRDVDTKSEEFNSDSFLFPWHLLEASNNDLFILNRSFEMLWILDAGAGVVKQVVKGFTKILEICGQIILDKSSLLTQIPSDLVRQQVDASISIEGISYAGLISSVTAFKDHIILCDTASQMVLKISHKSGMVSSFQFSNFAILGLPYWLSSPLERVYTVGAISSVDCDHIQHFSLLPGRIDIEMNVEVPEYTELAEPLEECCIARQVRGAAVEVSEFKNKGGSSGKVGVTQQWYDQLDNLAFITPEMDSGVQGSTITSTKQVQDKRILLGCSVNTSPGTSEVIILAALYLKLRCLNRFEESQERKAATIADILNPKGRDPCIEFLSRSNRDLGELIFMKPLHVRLKFDCHDHPKADNSKDIILTDSSISVDVSLR